MDKINGAYGTAEALRDNESRLLEENKNNKFYLDARVKVQKELDDVNAQMDEGVKIENKFRAAGFLPSEATYLLNIMRNQPIGKVINPLQFEGQQDKLYVLTPFKTVVEADVYIGTFQNQLITLSRKINEKPVSDYTLLELAKAALNKVYAKIRKRN